VLGNLCCGCNILMHNKFSCGHTVLENNLRENSSLSYLFTKPTKQVFKFVRTKTKTCALKLETIRGPSALSVYMSNLCFGTTSVIYATTTLLLLTFLQLDFVYRQLKRYVTIRTLQRKFKILVLTVWEFNKRIVLLLVVRFFSDCKGINKL
jgi:hypothetical protein